MEGTPTESIVVNDTEHTGIVSDKKAVQEFADHVVEGDYIAVVYETPGIGGWHRTMGTVTETTTTHGRFDDLRFDVEKSDCDSAGDGAYLHLNPNTGDYHFSDNTDDGEGHGVKQISWTPEN